MLRILKKHMECQSVVAISSRMVSHMVLGKKNDKDFDAKRT
jgi:hypothetical protein